MLLDEHERLLSDYATLLRQYETLETNFQLLAAFKMQDVLKHTDIGDKWDLSK